MMDCQDQLSVRHQCRLLGLDRRGLYYAPVGPDAGSVTISVRCLHRLPDFPMHIEPAAAVSNAA